jgi:hypothetical protein
LTGPAHRVCRRPRCVSRPGTWARRKVPRMWRHCAVPTSSSGSSPVTSALGLRRRVWHRLKCYLDRSLTSNPRFRGTAQRVRACAYTSALRHLRRCPTAARPAAKAVATYRPRATGVEHWPRRQSRMDGSGRSAHAYGSEGHRQLRHVTRQTLACPLRARREGQERYLTDTHGQPQALLDVRCNGQRGTTIQFPSR